MPRPQARNGRGRFTHGKSKGYVAGYSESHSPMYSLGKEHGATDAQLIADDKDPLGPQPPNPEYRTMYDRGYHDGLNGAA